MFLMSIHEFCSGSKKVIGILLRKLASPTCMPYIRLPKFSIVRSLFLSILTDFPLTALFKTQFPLLAAIFYCLSLKSPTMLS